MGVVLALLVSSLVLVNGVLFLFNPRLWMSIVNRVTRFTCGQKAGFRFSFERMSRADLLQCRFAGAAMAMFGGLMLTRVVHAAALWLSGSEAAPSTASGVAKGSGWIAVAGLMFLSLWALYGALLVINPRWTLRVFGTARSIDVSDRFLWVFRVVGAGLVVSGAYAILR